MTCSCCGAELDPSSPFRSVRINGTTSLMCADCHLAALREVESLGRRLNPDTRRRCPVCEGVAAIDGAQVCSYDCLTIALRDHIDARAARRAGHAFPPPIAESVDALLRSIQGVKA